MGSKICFSIIIPVFNVECYLAECLESVLSQSYSDYEVIIIDDGSTDGSSSICDTYAHKESRITLFRKENGGLSSARNEGLARAKGDYIIFLDSDDKLYPDALSNLAKALIDSMCPDVLITNITEMYTDLSTSLITPAQSSSVSLSKKEAITLVFQDFVQTWPATKYILTNEIIQQNCLRFKCGFLHEDLHWTAQLFIVANTFTYSDTTWYMHRLNRPGSITSTASYKHLADVLRLADMCLSDYRFSSMNPHERKMIFSRLSRAAFSSLRNFRSLNKEEREYAINDINKYWHVFTYAEEKRRKLFRIGRCILGTRISLKLMELVWP